MGGSHFILREEAADGRWSIVRSGSGWATESHHYLFISFSSGWVVMGPCICRDLEGVEVALAT